MPGYPLCSNQIYFFKLAHLTMGFRFEISGYSAEIFFFNEKFLPIRRSQAW